MCHRVIWSVAKCTSVSFNYGRHKNIDLMIYTLDRPYPDVTQHVVTHMSCHETHLFQVLHGKLIVFCQMRLHPASIFTAIFLNPKATHGYTFVAWHPSPSDSFAAWTRSSFNLLSVTSHTVPAMLDLISVNVYIHYEEKESKSSSKMATRLSISDCDMHLSSPHVIGRL